MIFFLISKKIKRKRKLLAHVALVGEEMPVEPKINTVACKIRKTECILLYKIGIKTKAIHSPPWSVQSICY